MTKIFAVAMLFALSACAGESKTEGTADSTAVTVDTAAVTSDSVTVVAPADSTAK